MCTPLYRYNGERLKLEGEIVIDRRGMFALHDDVRVRLGQFFFHSQERRRGKHISLSFVEELGARERSLRCHIYHE